MARDLEEEIERLQKLCDTYERDFDALEDEYNMMEDDLEKYCKAVREAKKICEASTQELKLHMGEMTAQEVRSVKAALGWVFSVLKDVH